MAIEFKNPEDLDKSTKRQHAPPNRSSFSCPKISPKGFVQGATVRYGNPHPEKMPSLFRFHEILESGSTMKGRPIVEKNKFASFERESDLEFFAFANGIEEIQRCSLKSGKVRALFVLIRSINEYPKIRTGEKVLCPGEDRLLAVGEVVPFVDYMSLVGKRPAEDIVQIRSFLEYDLFDPETTNHMVLSANLRRLQAEESNDVTSIRMKPEFPIGIRATRPRIIRFVGFVSNAEDQISIGALGYRCSNVSGKG